MAHRDGPLPATVPRWSLLALSCLLVGLIAGCGSPISPEQKEAFIKYQAMGGRVNFRSGGYEVDLSRTQATDADLALLKNISNVTSIDLRNTKVTDEGLDHLQTITTLEFVGLPRETVTAEAAASLREALPDAKVQH